MSNVQERNGSLTPVISTLKEQARWYREFHDEAGRLLRVHSDIEGYKKYLREATKLMVGLPDKILRLLEGVPSSAVIRMALRDLQLYERKAENALDLCDYGSMGSLLWPREVKKEEENELEVLIVRLERHHV
jgi:hypothetical protein